MSTQPSQSKTIRLQLLSAMKEGAYANSERLPRESVLAEKLGISRTQLRDILASLEREGFITRRHGVGTIINRHVLDATARMDIEVEFLDMIRQSGYRAEVAFVRVSDGTADAKIARQLAIEEGAPVIRVARLCTADGRPAIYCEDVVDKSLVRGNYTITLAETLQISVGAPVLYMDEVDFDIDGKPVFCSQEYFADGFFRHTVLRKKL